MRVPCELIANSTHLSFFDHAGQGVVQDQRVFEAWVRLDQNVASAAVSADTRTVLAASGTSAFVWERRVHVTL